jgi:hypothetical protein
VNIPVVVGIILLVADRSVVINSWVDCLMSEMPTVCVFVVDAVSTSTDTEVLACWLLYVTDDIRRLELIDEGLAISCVGDLKKSADINVDGLVVIESTFSMSAAVVVFSDSLGEVETSDCLVEMAVLKVELAFASTADDAVLVIMPTVDNDVDVNLLEGGNVTVRAVGAAVVNGALGNHV